MGREVIRGILQTVISLYVEIAFVTLLTQFLQKSKHFDHHHDNHCINHLDHFFDGHLTNAGHDLHNILA